MEKGRYYWIGLTDSAVEGQFIWEHSSKPLEWSHWAWFEPNNARGNEDCVMSGYGNDGVWDDMDCNCNVNQYSGHIINALCQYRQE